jgi:hypothetical protein
MRGKILRTANEIHKKEIADYPKIRKVLADDNLICKEVPDGEDSLFKAVSEGLHFTSAHSKEIQEFCIKHLGELITTNKLPPRLEMFRGNTILWNAYLNNQLSAQFCEINLELVSLAFKVRVIVYTVTEDEILNAIIFNNKFEKSIQLIRSYGCHFDVVCSQKGMQNIAFCENIVFKVFNEAVHNPKEMEGTDKYTDTRPRVSTESKDALEPIAEDIKESREETRGHKRTRSDSELKPIEESQNNLEFYKSFVDSKPLEEISSLVEKDIAKFSDKPNTLINLNLITESKPSDTSIEESSGLKLGYVRSIPSRTRIIEEDEELLTPDFDIKFEKSKSYIDPKALQKSPVHFINALPPGLTPNRYATKTYGHEDFSQAIMDKGRTSQTGSIGHLDEEHQPTSHSNAPTRSRTGSRTLSLSTQSEEFKKIRELQGGLNQDNDNPQAIQKNPSSEKKKPVIIDESHQRYTGRLKFFDEGKSYGFIVMDDDGSDIFVHYDDLHKANITKELLKSSKSGGNSIRLSFSCLEYIGKYNRSRKATDIQMVN